MSRRSVADDRVSGMIVKCIVRICHISIPRFKVREGGKLFLVVTDCSVRFASKMEQHALVDPQTVRVSTSF